MALYGQLKTSFAENADAFGQHADKVLQSSRHFPRVDFSVCNQCPEAIKKLNCYSSAINVSTSKYMDPSEGPYPEGLVPGEIAYRKESFSQPDFLIKMLAFNLLFQISYGHDLQFFKKDIITGAIKDGLEYTAEEIPLKRGGFPVALFFSEVAKDQRGRPSKDFHFYGVRLDRAGCAVWIHKTPGSKAGFFPHNDIFSHAKNSGYDEFAGYFWRPDNLDC